MGEKISAVFFSPIFGHQNPGSGFTWNAGSGSTTLLFVIVPLLKEALKYGIFWCTLCSTLTQRGDFVEDSSLCFPLSSEYSLPWAIGGGSADGQRARPRRWRAGWPAQWRGRRQASGWWWTDTRGRRPSPSAHTQSTVKVTEKNVEFFSSLK